MIQIWSNKMETGFERKTLRVTIENWLYHPDVKVRIAAATEVRARLSKSFPRPSYLQEHVKNGSNT
jgi:hypothetical protein